MGDLRWRSKPADWEHSTSWDTLWLQPWREETEAHGWVTALRLVGEGRHVVAGAVRAVPDLAERRGNSQSAELEPAAGPGDVPSEASEGIRREDDQPFAQALAVGQLSDYWEEVAEEGIFTFEPPEEPLELDQPEELAEPGAVGNSTGTLGELDRKSVV